MSTTSIEPADLPAGAVRSCDGVRALAYSLVKTPLNVAITVACAAILVWLLPGLIDWAVLQAHWAGPAALCRTPEAGACWSFVAEKFRFMVFGFYPFAEQWRPLCVLGLLMVALAAGLYPPLRNLAFFCCMPLLFAAMYVLMAGGILGLSPIATRQWGGIPLTLMLSVFGIALALPIAILLALGRQSTYPLVRLMCIGYIEIIRGVPLIGLIFMATNMLPLFLPTGFNLDQVLRAQAAMMCFAAAYLAEVVRAGLQAVPRGQIEAATALGLGYWKIVAFVILPQALRVATPALISTVIGLFKDTSLVIIVGLTEFFGAVRSSTNDPNWLGFDVEAYVFAALVYFCFCKSIARYGRYLEQRGAAGRN